MDLRFVKMLQPDARVSNKEPARCSGISASTCLERVRRLVESGVLVGFHAKGAPQALVLALRR